MPSVRPQFGVAEVPPTVLRAVFKKNMIEADLIERFLEVLLRGVVAY